MRTKRSLAVLLVLTMSSGACAAKNITLDTLASQLRYVRSLAVEEKTNMACPENLTRLRGLAMPVVLAALLEPDFKEDNSSKSEWSYFLTSPSRSGVESESESIHISAGGGFPIVTFSFGRRERVERVTCSYAR
jgi:hypothetical protein